MGLRLYWKGPPVASPVFFDRREVHVVAQLLQLGVGRLERGKDGRHERRKHGEAEGEEDRALGRSFRSGSSALRRKPHAMQSSPRMGGKIGMSPPRPTDSWLSPVGLAWSASSSRAGMSLKKRWAIGGLKLHQRKRYESSKIFFFLHPSILLLLNMRHCHTMRASALAVLAAVFSSPQATAFATAGDGRSSGTWTSRHRGGGGATAAAAAAAAAGTTSTSSSPLLPEALGQELANEAVAWAACNGFQMAKPEDESTPPVDYMHAPFSLLPNAVPRGSSSAPWRSRRC